MRVGTRKCAICNESLSIFTKHLRCDECKIYCHNKCAPKVPTTCGLTDKMKSDAFTFISHNYKLKQTVDDFIKQKTDKKEGIDEYDKDVRERSESIDSLRHPPAVPLALEEVDSVTVVPVANASEKDGIFTISLSSKSKQLKSKSNNNSSTSISNIKKNNSKDNINSNNTDKSINDKNNNGNKDNVS